MNRKLQSSAAASSIVALFASAAIADGPFGVSAGDPINKFPACKRSSENDNVYICSSLPRTHSSFENYRVVVAPGVGVCRVHARGKTIKDDYDGEKTRQEVDYLADQLKLKYGDKFSKFDFTTSGVTDEQPQQWLMWVALEKRQYTYMWVPETGYAPIDRVLGIALYAKALTPKDGWVRLDFEFDNEAACSSAWLASEADAF